MGTPDLKSKEARVRGKAEPRARAEWSLACPGRAPIWAPRVTGGLLQGSARPLCHGRPGPGFLSSLLGLHSLVVTLGAWVRAVMATFLPTVDCCSNETSRRDSALPAVVGQQGARARSPRAPATGSNVL